MFRVSPFVRTLFLTVALCASYSVAEAQDVTLTVTVDGVVSGAVGIQGPNGNVCNPNPGGGVTNGTCVFTYPVDTPLRIAANSPNPDAGFLHSGSGDALNCKFSSCNITLNVNSAITATFDASQGPVASIETTLWGDGKGNVGTDNGQCQNFELGYTDCTTYYAVGSEVKFVGHSLPGNIFERFSEGFGDTAACGAASTCIFTATTNSTVKATFSALASVAIDPPAPTITVGQNQGFSAIATFTNDMFRYGFDGNQPWMDHTPMDVARFSLAAAVVNDRLYAIGGVDGTCPSSPCEFAPLGTVEMFNPLVTAYAEFEQAWTPRHSMGTPREGFAAAVVNGKIYAFGGHTTGGGPVDSMEVFDPVANAWSPGASMGEGARSGMAAAVINNTIYAVGGNTAVGGDPSVPLATVEAYSEGTGWTRMEPMLIARSGAGAAAVNGTLYVIGGDDGGTVEAYDLGDPVNPWSMKAPIPDGGGEAVAAALNGLIYAVSGPSGALKVYNPALNSWAPLGSMPSSLNQFGFAVLDGRLFAAGGLSGGTTAVATLSAHRPPEATWWSSNTAVGQFLSGNNGNVHGQAVGTATISARLVGVDSGEQSAVLTVTEGGGGGGGGSTIFVNGPNEAFTQVGQANWNYCGSFMQNDSAGPWEVTINYGDGGDAELTPFLEPSGPCAGGPGTKGVFVFNHAYSSPGTFHVVVTVKNTATNAIGTDEFDVQVQEDGGGGGGEDECVPIIANIAVIGSVPFDRVMVKVFDRVTGQLLTDDETALPLGSFDEASLPAGHYRFEFSVPDGYDGYMVTPSSVEVDAVCGEPIRLNVTVQAIPTVPPTIVSLTPSQTSLWPVNQKYHAITIAVVAHDANGADISGQCSIISASSNEPNTGNDFVITGPLSINLRAARLGGGDGRIYTATVQCTDGNGLSATGDALVTVPKSQGKK
jgi:N-acetylneuraminic acid mutarotase